jgi:hypothetical protein
MKKLCMEKKMFPEAEAEILCSGRVREEKFPNPAAGVAILRRSCYCKGTEKKPCKPSGTMKIRCGTGSVIVKTSESKTTRRKIEQKNSLTLLDTFSGLNGSFLLHTIKKEKQGNALKTSQCLVARRNFYGTYVFTHGPAVFCHRRVAAGIYAGLLP